MPQFLKVFLAAGLVVAGCALAPAPATLKTTTLQLSMAGLYPSQRQLQYLMPGATARVSVTGPGMASPLVQVAPISGETTSITLSGVPMGPNRVVTLETLDEAGQPIPGGRLRTALTLGEGSNLAVVSLASSVGGDVFEALQQAGSDLARTLDAFQVQRTIDAIKQAQRVPHFGLIDGAAIAERLLQNGGQLSQLDVTTTALVQSPTALTVKVSGLPENLQASVWVNDPVSPKQSGLGNGTLNVQPVKPGTWQLYGRAGSLRVGPISVDLASNQQVELNFSTAQVLAQSLPQPRGGAASGVLTVDGKRVLMVAGGSLPNVGSNASTDSVLVFDGTTWATRSAMPTPVSHSAYTVNGNKLYVMGGFAPLGASKLVQVYDATTGTWSTNLPEIKYRTYVGAAACIGDSLYMTSGMAGSVADWSIYKLPLDGSATEWQEFGADEAEPQLRFARYGTTVAAVGGKLYVFGGAHGDDTLMHRVEVYDPVKATMRELAPMPTARHGAFSWVKDGKVYVMGGINASGQALANVEVYDVATDTWSVRPMLKEARGHAAVGELNGKLVIAGGNDGYFAYDDVSLRASVETLAF